MLQQAIEKVGKIDRAAVSQGAPERDLRHDHRQDQAEDGLLPIVWWVGQWQDGEFVGLAPTTLSKAPAAGRAETRVEVS